jgi:flagellar biosynthesis GTPase FlhF
MVNELVFRAADTATALEKVQDNLGENAFIIEIKNIGNFVEITASLQEPLAVKGAAKTAPKNSVLVLSQRLQKNTALPTGRDGTNFGESSDLDESLLNIESESQARLEHGPRHDKEIYTANEAASPQPVALEKKRLDQEQNELVWDLPEGESPLQNTLHAPAPEAADNPIASDRASAGFKPIEAQSDRLSFGDLLNIGLTNSLIKKEFSISEFSGSITKDHLLNTLIRLLGDSNSRKILDVYYNIVFLGTPGSGKSTICAKFMQHYCLFREEKPRILQVSPDKFFELDRLSYFARLFNFPFEKQQQFNSEAVFHVDKQLTEVSWDYYFEFFEALAQQGKHLPHAKLLLVLPASINTGSLAEVLRVSRGVNSVILNKCDYGRITIKHLMMLYQHNCKIVGLSGDTEVNEPIEFIDEPTMRGFIEYVLNDAL